MSHPEISFWSFTITMPWQPGHFSVRKCVWSWLNHLTRLQFGTSLYSSERWKTQHTKWSVHKDDDWPIFNTLSKGLKKQQQQLQHQTRRTLRGTEAKFLCSPGFPYWLMVVVAGNVWQIRLCKLRLGRLGELPAKAQGSSAGWIPIWIDSRMWSLLGMPLWSARRRRFSPQSDPPYLQVADNTIGLWFVQSARWGHCELLSSADKKVASGRVAAAFCTAVTELWFLSTHSGTPQGYNREKEEESKGQARAKEKQQEGQGERERGDSKERRIHRKTQKRNKRRRDQESRDK